MTSDNTNITCVAPGANADVMLYDESANGTITNALKPSSSTRRVCVDIFGDQIVTVFHEILLKDAGSWRAVNGAGDATTASTLFDKEYPLKAGLNRIRIHGGATPPTANTWEARLREMQGRFSPT